MSTTSRPPRPSIGASSLKPPKTRQSTGGIPTPRSTTPKLRQPSSIAKPYGPPENPPPTSGLPSRPSTASSGRSLKKSGSVPAFPHPPSGSRASFGPSSPGGRKSKPLTTKTGPSSFLNGTDEGNSVPGVQSSNSNSYKHTNRISDTSSHNPSRSSSAQDSYSTSATNYEDGTDAAIAIKPPSKERELRSSDKDDKQGNVVVSLRIRPEMTEQYGEEWSWSGQDASVTYDPGKTSRAQSGSQTYNYHYVFQPDSNNEDVYDCIGRRLVTKVMEGYNGLVFAYGNTGTGKTFSMQGTANSPGVIPLAITDIFAYIRQNPSREFLLRVSYMEVYKETIYDLLNMASGQPDEPVHLKQDAKRGFYASPLKEEIVQSPTQLLRVIARGDAARRTASTKFNARSSRSHAIVQVTVESRERINGMDAKRSALTGGVRVSTLSLVDLAGSEKAVDDVDRFAEGKLINMSLLHLGQVINALSKSKGKGVEAHAFRNSKLTQLLQSALSGDSVISILCTVGLKAMKKGEERVSAANETLKTLRFALDAKAGIVSRAKKGEEVVCGTGNQHVRGLLEQYRLEIENLKNQLEDQAKEAKRRVTQDEIEKDKEEREKREESDRHRHDEQLLEMQLARTALKERIDHLNRLILSSKSIGVNSTGTMSALGNYRHSQTSIRSSVTTAHGVRPGVERSSSMTSSSTVGRRSSGQSKLPDNSEPVEEDDSIGEFGDGTASLAAQNRALQADLEDKNRYIATLEKRLVQARRASHSRTSAGFSASGKGSILVGEDHSVAALLRDKDAEIADLRARIDDKDRMLAALRSSVRSKAAADLRDRTSVESRASKHIDDETRTNTPLISPVSQLSRGSHSHLSAVSSVRDSVASASAVPITKELSGPIGRKRGKSVDEMSRILDEMIADKVSSGHLVRSMTGSVRLAQSAKIATLPNPPTADLPPAPLTPIPPTPTGERPGSLSIEA